MARRKGPFRKLISRAYKGLSIANTISTLLSGDPVKISRHLARKKTVAWGSKIIPGTK